MTSNQNRRYTPPKKKPASPTSLHARIPNPGLLLYQLGNPEKFPTPEHRRAGAALLHGWLASRNHPLGQGTVEDLLLTAEHVHASLTGKKVLGIRLDDETVVLADIARYGHLTSEDTEEAVEELIADGLLLKPAPGVIVLLGN